MAGGLFPGPEAAAEAAVPTIYSGIRLRGVPSTRRVARVGQRSRLPTSTRTQLAPPPAPLVPVYHLPHPGCHWFLGHESLEPQSSRIDLSLSN